MTCPVVNGGRLTLGTTRALCFVTCDTIRNSFGCSSFTPSIRSLKINGVTMTGCDLNKIPTSTRTHANGFSYYYFEVGAGGHTWDEIYWSGTTATSCPTPPGGFTP